MSDVVENVISETHPSDDVQSRSIEALYDVPVQVSVVLGRVLMPVHQLLKIGRGAVIELDKKVGEPLDIYVNNRLVARGEVVQQGEQFAITMVEMVKNG